MRLVINASNVRSGGGLTLILRLLQDFLQLRQADSILLICPAGAGYEQLAACNQVQLYSVPDKFHKSYLYKIYYNSRVLPKVAEAFKPDKIVSLGNVAFPRNGIPQLVYIQLPHLLYPESAAWQHMTVREYAVNRAMVAYVTMNLRHATSIMVQTAVMEQRIKAKFETAQHVYILPNAARMAPVEHATQFGPFSKSRPLSLLFPSAWYPHKNFESLLPLAKAIVAAELPVTITLTLDSNNTAAADFLSRISATGFENILPSIGYLEEGRLQQLWGGFDGLFLPSLMESFSGTFLNAAVQGKAIFVSDLEYATSLLGEAAIYFNPLSMESMLAALQQAVDNPALLSRKAALAKSWGNQQPQALEVAHQFSRIVDTFA